MLALPTFVASIILGAIFVQYTIIVRAAGFLPNRHRHRNSWQQQSWRWSSSSTSTVDDFLRWEQMYESGRATVPPDPHEQAIQPADVDMIRVISFDLDNTIWNTTATIQAANDALAEYLQESCGVVLSHKSHRVEYVMKDLFENNKAKYGGGKAPVLLTALRKDAIQHVLVHHSTIKQDQEEGTLFELANSAFDHWANARHQAISEHLADSAIECIQDLIAALPNNVLIVAITDGNSDPMQVKDLSEFFAFCVNAEQVGISKPDKRVYLQAVRQALEHPLLHDLISDTDALTDNVEDLIGPWWVHIGDDFVKDVVAAKSLKMRTIWSRELILKEKDPEKIGSWDSKRKSEENVEQFVKKVSAMQTIKMQVGAEDYLADSLQKEFADAIVDRFVDLATVIKEWHIAAVEMSVTGASTREADVLEPGPFREHSKQLREAKFCIFCGESLAPVAKFCSTCGEKQQ